MPHNYNFFFTCFFNLLCFITNAEGYAIDLYLPLSTRLQALEGRVLVLFIIPSHITYSISQHIFIVPSA